MSLKPGRYFIQPLGESEQLVDFGELENPNRVYVTSPSEARTRYLWEVKRTDDSGYFFVTSVREPEKFLSNYLDGQGVVVGPQFGIQVIREKSITDREAYSIRGPWRPGVYGASDWYVVEGEEEEGKKKLTFLTSHSAPLQQADSVFWEFVPIERD